MSRSLNQNSFKARMTMKDTPSQCLLVIRVSVYCQIEEPSRSKQVSNVVEENSSNQMGLTRSSRLFLLTLHP